MPIPSLVALGLAAAFATLAALHVYWATGRGAAGDAGVPTRPDGTPLFRPGCGATLDVAAALTAAAIVVLARSGVLTPVGPATLYRTGAWALGTVLLLRAVGDFRYVGLFKRERATRFARLDTHIYTPLCAALAAGVFYLAAT